MRNKYKIVSCVRNFVTYRLYDIENEIRKYEDLNELYFNIVNKIERN